MYFQELAKKVGFSLAVVLQYEQLRGNNEFWSSRTFEEWLDLYFNDAVPAKVKERAFTALQSLAKTFSDLVRIANCSRKETELKKWALAQMEQRASTFQERAIVSKRRGSYDFAKLLELANSVEDLASFCSLVVSNARMQGSEQYIDSALAKMSAMAVAGCQEWISFYCQAISEKVRQFLLSQIKRFDLPTKAWLSFQLGGSHILEGVIFEKALASAKSFDDCSRVYNAEFSYGDRKIRAIEKAIGFAKTMEELKWAASRNNHREPLAAQIVDKMAHLAQSFDEWRLVYFYSRPENLWRAKAFEKMKELALA